MPTPPTSDVDRGVQRLARRHPLALIWLGVLLYATGPVLARATSVDAAVFTVHRIWIGLVILSIATSIHVRTTGRRPSRSALRFAFLTGLVWGTHQLLFFGALKLTSVTDVSLVSALSPVVTGIIALPLFGERPAKSFWAWGSLAMLGTAVVVLSASAGPTGNVLGMTLAVLNIGVFAVFYLQSKRSREVMDVLPFLLGVTAGGAIPVLTFAFAVGADVTQATGRDLLLITATAAGAGGLGHFVMTWPLRYLPANLPPLLRLMTPVFAIILAAIFLGESVTVWHLIGGGITLVGVAGAVTSRAGRDLLREAANERQTSIPEGGDPVNVAR